MKNVVHDDNEWKTIKLNLVKIKWKMFSVCLNALLHELDQMDLHQSIKLLCVNIK